MHCEEQPRRPGSQRACEAARRPPALPGCMLWEMLPTLRALRGRGLAGPGHTLGPLPPLSFSDSPVLSPCCSVMGCAANTIWCSPAGTRTRSREIGEHRSWTEFNYISRRSPPRPAPPGAAGPGAPGFSPDLRHSIAMQESAPGGGEGAGGSLCGRESGSVSSADSGSARCERCERCEARISRARWKLRSKIAVAPRRRGLMAQVAVKRTR